MKAVMDRVRKLRWLERVALICVLSLLCSVGVFASNDPMIIILPPCQVLVVYDTSWWCLWLGICNHTYRCWFIEPCICYLP